MIKLTINGNEYEVQDNLTILEVAKSIGIKIPTLCHMDLHGTKMVNQAASCRVCVVEVEGRRNLAPACATIALDGMVIRTSTPRLIKARRTVVELLLSDHPADCLVCERNRKCELQSIACDLGIRDIKYSGKRNHSKKDVSSYSIIRNQEKCILCRRCETMCNKVQSVGVYSAVHRGFPTKVGTAFDNDMVDTCCTFCGQCVSVCPTGALAQVDNTSEVWDALADPDKFVIVQTAPAVRAALGEEFGLEPGTDTTGKMVSALHAIGFDKVYDTNFGADLTIVEEANEFAARLKEGKLPMITSCCPAWIKFIEHQFPNLTNIPSTCKSPQQMFGAIAKTYLAEKLGVKRENMVVVSVMPCLAKKYESKRPEFNNDVDISITTREFASMVKEAGIDFMELKDGKFDDIMGQSTGAADIFGATGGVMEAAVRTAAAWLEGGEAPKIDWTELRGLDGIREAEVAIAGHNLKLAIACGLSNVREIFQRIEDGEKFDLIEVMACPGGCIGGGGQPYYAHQGTEVHKKRAEALYKIDKNKKMRMSHENPDIIKLYDDYLGEYGGHKAHELLHTTFTKRKIY